MLTAAAVQGALVSSSDDEVTLLDTPDGSAAAAELVRLARRRIAGQAGGEAGADGLDMDAGELPFGIALFQRQRSG